MADFWTNTSTASAVTLATLGESRGVVDRLIKAREEDDRRIFRYPGPPALFYRELERAGVDWKLPTASGPIHVPFDGLRVDWVAELGCTIVGTTEGLRRFYSGESDRVEVVPMLAKKGA
jgi:hypothetical protein